MSMKRYVMEFVGTFFLTVAISLIGNPIAIGLMLMAMIYVGGHVSGAHFNPAISFACFVQNRMKAADMGMYIAAQSLGATLALCFFMMITNNSFTLDMVPGSPMFGPMAIEALLVLVLCWVYLTMNVSNRYKDTAIAGFVIGLTLMAIVSAGSLFNPAVAIASIICNVIKDGGAFGGMSSVVVYIAGPLLGGFAASYMFDYFRSEPVNNR
jgi:aquaporin Z